MGAVECLELRKHEVERWARVHDGGLSQRGQNWVVVVGERLHVEVGVGVERRGCGVRLATVVVMQQRPWDQHARTIQAKHYPTLP